MAVSSARQGTSGERLTDRVAQRADAPQAWTSTPGHAAGQWARLTFPVPVVVRRVRLYNLPDGAAASSLRVAAATVRLFADASATTPLAERRTGPVSPGGTDVAFPEVTATVVQVTLDEVTGKVDGVSAAGLAENRSAGQGRQSPAHADDRAAVSRRLSSALTPA